MEQTETTVPPKRRWGVHAQYMSTAVLLLRPFPWRPNLLLSTCILLCNVPQRRTTLTHGITWSCGWQFFPCSNYVNKIHSEPWLATGLGWTLNPACSCIQAQASKTWIKFTQYSWNTNEVKRAGALTSEPCLQGSRDIELPFKKNFRVQSQKRSAWSVTSSSPALLSVY